MDDDTATISKIPILGKILGLPEDIDAMPAPPRAKLKGFKNNITGCVYFVDSGEKKNLTL